MFCANDLAESQQLDNFSRLWAWSSCCKLLSALARFRQAAKKNYSIEVGWVFRGSWLCKKARGYVNPPGWPERKINLNIASIVFLRWQWWLAHVDTLINKLVHVHCLSRRWRSISDVLVIVTDLWVSWVGMLVFLHQLLTWLNSIWNNALAIRWRSSCWRLKTGKQINLTSAAEGVARRAGKYWGMSNAYTGPRR